ncbi:serine/threonine protein phosphatase 1 [Marinobacter sp. MBR-105]
MLCVMPENQQGIDWVVGDIHGHLSELMAALDSSGFNAQRDRLFSVGDLIDRGPDSHGVLDLLFVPEGQRQWFFPVRGNHEQLMIDAIDGDVADRLNWIRNGGQWGLDIDPGDLQMIVEDKLRHLPLAIEVPCSDRTVGIVHADVSSGVWGRFSPVNDLWSRSRFGGARARGPRVEGVDVVVVGHCVLDSVTCHQNVVGIDTGVYRPDGRLTLMRLSDVVSVICGP